MAKISSEVASKYTQPNRTIHKLARLNLRNYFPSIGCNTKDGSPSSCDNEEPNDFLKSGHILDSMHLLEGFPLILASATSVKSIVAFVTEETTMQFAGRPEVHAWQYSLQ